MTCPHCKTPLATPDDGPLLPNTIIPAATGLKMMAKYSRDDGAMEELDMLPFLTEEAMIITHPNTARAHALHDYCASGDLPGISKCLMEAELLHGGAAGKSMSPAELLAWRDPLDMGRSCLHAAVVNAQRETAWLLLYVASTLPDAYFSPEVLHALADLGVSRWPEFDASQDVRALVDLRGDTPETLALGMGAAWLPELELGVLVPPPPTMAVGMQALPPSMEPTFESHVLSV